MVDISPKNDSKLYYNASKSTVYYNDNPQFAYGITPTYVLRFAAYNGVTPTTTCSLIVNIARAPQGPDCPQCPNYCLNVTESTTIGQTLWDMRIRDNSSNSHSYAIYDIDPQAIGKFEITSNGSKCISGKS